MRGGSHGDDAYSKLYQDRVGAAGIRGGWDALAALRVADRKASQEGTGRVAQGEYVAVGGEVCVSLEDPHRESVGWARMLDPPGDRAAEDQAD